MCSRPAITVPMAAKTAYSADHSRREARSKCSVPRNILRTFVPRWVAKRRHGVRYRDFQRNRQ